MLQLEHPLFGGIQKREVLSKDRISEFARGLGHPEHRGIFKVWTPYLIKFKLRDDHVYELKATGEMYSARDKDDYYGFAGGTSFLKQFFPKIFE